MKNSRTRNRNKTGLHFSNKTFIACLNERDVKNHLIIEKFTSTGRNMVSQNPNLSIKPDSIEFEFFTQVIYSSLSIYAGTIIKKTASC
jgi:hypothetical protein